MTVGITIVGVGVTVGSGSQFTSHPHWPSHKMIPGVGVGVGLFCAIVGVGVAVGLPGSAQLFPQIN
jgi:hypothetical protein